MKSSDPPGAGFEEGIDEGLAEIVGFNEGSTDGCEIGADEARTITGCELGAVETDGLFEGNKLALGN